MSCVINYFFDPTLKRIEELTTKFSDSLSSNASTVKSSIIATGLSVSFVVVCATAIIRFNPKSNVQKKNVGLKIFCNEHCCSEVCAELRLLRKEIYQFRSALERRQVAPIETTSGSTISEFVSANTVVTFSEGSDSIDFHSLSKKQVILLCTSDESEKVLPGFNEAAQYLKGKLLFVHVVDQGAKRVAGYFGVSGVGPKVIGYLGIDDGRKYICDGDLTPKKIKEFAEKFLVESLKTIYKSDHIADTDEAIKIVTGNNFDEVVLDESKNVLLQIYKPGSDHCQALEPSYNKLAKDLRSIESLVIAKMEWSANEHPRAKAVKFPTILFFKAGSKNSDPITVEMERTDLALYKFLEEHESIPKEHAFVPEEHGSIPITLQKLASSTFCSFL